MHPSAVDVSLEELEESLGNSLKQRHTPNPLEWRSLLKTKVDGKDVDLHYPREHFETVILPLCKWLRSLVDTIAHGKSHRILVGIAGPAAAGKSSLSIALAAACNLLWTLDGATGDAKEWVFAHSMDAYHLPNEHLESQNSGLHTWKQLKGHKFTLDVEAFISDLHRLKSDPGEVLLPIYDRSLHEAVAGALTVKSHHKLIIVEGLHLLAEEPPWDTVGSCLDRTVAMVVPLEWCKGAVIARKVAGGRDVECATAHFDRVDGPIFDEIKTVAHKAHVTLTLAPQHDSHLSVLSIDIIKPRNADSNIDDENIYESISSCDPGSGGLLFVGLNSAVTRWFQLKDGAPLRPLKVNRAAKGGIGIGGKGQNAAACVATQITKNTSKDKHPFVRTIMFSGGLCGRELERMLREKGVHMIVRETKAETRSCVTIVGERGATELVGPWGGDGKVTKAEADDLLVLISESISDAENVLIPNTKWSWVVPVGVAIMGSLPPGVDGLYASELLRTLKLPDGVRLLIDSVAPGLPFLLKVAEETGVTAALKLNASELLAISEDKDEDDIGQTVEISVVRSAFALLDKYPALEWVAGTAGGEPGVLVCRAPADSNIPWKRYWQFHVPGISPSQGLINATGAGDAVTAMTLRLWANGWDPVSSVKWGLACATASCLHTDNSIFEKDLAIKIHENIVTREVFVL